MTLVREFESNAVIKVADKTVSYCNILFVLRKDSVSRDGATSIDGVIIAVQDNIVSLNGYAVPRAT